MSSGNKLFFNNSYTPVFFNNSYTPVLFSVSQKQPEIHLMVELILLSGGRFQVIFSMEFLMKISLLHVFIFCQKRLSRIYLEMNLKRIFDVAKLLQSIPSFFVNIVFVKDCQGFSMQPNSFLPFATKGCQGYLCCCTFADLFHHFFSCRLWQYPDNIV